MKHLYALLLAFLTWLFLFIPALGSPILQNADNPTLTSVVLPADTLPPIITQPSTETVQPTEAPFGRPQIIIKTYKTSAAVTQGKDFVLSIRVENVGQYTAYNSQAVFSSEEIIPLKSGGVVFLGNLNSGQGHEFKQSMTVIASLEGKTALTVGMTMTYYDENGVVYNETFSIVIPVVSTIGGNVVYATTTPTGFTRSQLVIMEYESDIPLLQPGLQFILKIKVRNVGNLKARSVTMVVGGGQSASAGDGTPQAGGVSGASGEFTNFAPMDSSNVQALGDVEAGSEIEVTQHLIVNVTTNPGAYPLKISFLYSDEKGNLIHDEQVVTLLVYQLPLIEASFYQPLTGLVLGQPNGLPIQIINTGKKSIILGSVKLRSNNGEIENGNAYIGPLEAGGYFTMDAIVFPQAAGALEIEIEINYTDDFNQPRSLLKTLALPVEEMTGGDVLPPDGMPGGENNYENTGEETFWRKLWRIVLGLLGLDSAAPGVLPNQPSGEMP